MKTESPFVLSPAARRAVTLVEVIFAIGVVLIGMLGLLSVMTLAGRRAQDSVSLNVGAAYSNTVVDFLKSKQYLANEQLVGIRRSTAQAPVTLLNAPPVPATRPNVAGPTSFCLDPLYASHTTVPATPSGSGYTSDLFPFFYPNHNPLDDPAIPVTLGTWPVNQPRLPRVGIALPQPNRNFVDVEQSRFASENPDDLNVFFPDDATLSATFPALRATTSGVEYGKRLPEGTYTWFATVNPFPGNTHASVSVVVLKERERTFDVPAPVATGVTAARNNAVSERVAYVTYGSGFSGGAGGIVHLVASQSVVSDLSANDWLMLSRIVGGRVVHRWYRVAALDGDAEELTVDGNASTDDMTMGCRFPGGNAGKNVWRRKVLLDGSDWSFGFNPGPYADNTFGDNTYATLVKDVVSVTERVVQLQGL